MNFTFSSASRDQVTLPTLNSPSSASLLGTSSGTNLGESSLSKLSGHASSLVFVDAGVANYQSLLAGAKPGEEVYVLDPTQDAIAQITQTLLTKTGVSSVHIVSHGEAGGLDFSNSVLNLADLPSYASQLQSWKSALTDDADVLLYGCNVGQGELGQAFVSILSQLTGADVAASNNLTGNSALGGDWNLEVETGKIESPLAFDSSVLSTYSSTLVGQNILTDSFINSDVNEYNWLYGITGSSLNPYLTARDTTAPTQTGGLPGSPSGTALDSSGSGTLRLTNNSGSQGSFVIYNQPLNSSSGLSINFDIYSYGGSTPGADGISFFLIDGSKSPTTSGAVGGALGYSKSSTQSGIVGGYLGIGFDEYGNFSNNGYGNGGISGTAPQSVVLRGNEASGYQYLTGTDVVKTTGYKIDGTTRTDAKRHVQIDITPQGLVTVQMDANNNGTFDSNEKLIDSFDVTTVNGALPGTFKFGFSASTGGSTNIHEINNFQTNTYSGAYTSLVNFTSSSATVTEGSSYVVTANIDVATTSDVVIPIALSGTATNGTDFNGVPASITIKAGQKTGSFTLNALSDTVYDPGETVTVTMGTPTSGNAALSSQNTSLTATIADPTRVSFTAASGTVTEGGNLVLTAQISNPLTQTVTIPITLSGTATNGKDYTIPSTITIAANQTTGTVTLGTIDDSIYEGSRTAIVTMGTPTNAALDSQNTVYTATITDNETQPSVNISNARVLEGSTGVNRSLQFTVSLSNPSAQPVSVQYSTADGSATVADNDYTALSNQITFAAGETTKTITVNVIGDNKVEPNETLKLILSNPTGATLGTNFTGIGTIVSDELATESGDFDGDGNPDILWHNPQTGEVGFWKMNGMSKDSSVVVTSTGSSKWLFEGIADFDGDGKLDILWRDQTNGDVAMWKMNGMSLDSAFIVHGADLNWQIEGLADFDGDGKVDILWRDSRNGDVGMWKMNGMSFDSASIVHAADQSWEIEDLADFDGDGKVDILWRNKNNGDVGMWKMNGMSFDSASIVHAADQSWEIEDLADFDGDGKVDILWRNKNSGGVGIWKMNGMSFDSSSIVYPSVNTGWQIKSVADFDGDGKVDLLWQQELASQVGFWKMNNIAYDSTPPVIDYPSGTKWQIESAVNAALT